MWTQANVDWLYVFLSLKTSQSSLPYPCSHATGKKWKSFNCNSMASGLCTSCKICVGQEHTLQLQDIQITLAASPTASQEAPGAAAASQPLAAGQFQLSSWQQSTPLAAYPQPLATALAHHWSWSRTATAQEAPAGASASQTVSIMTKAFSRQPRAAQSGQGGSSETIIHWCVQPPIHPTTHPSIHAILLHPSQPLAWLRSLFSIRIRS